MDTSVVSRVYLETLSTADLIALADEYGIDIPENLNRRFIIGELLEAAEEINDSNSEEMQEVDEIPSSFTLPLSYNKTGSIGSRQKSQKFISREYAKICIRCC